MACLGLKQGLDVKNRAAQPRQVVPGVPPPPRGVK